MAPVKIGNNTTIAAGSTITKDVQSDALGVARAKQSNKDNWSKKKDKKCAVLLQLPLIDM